MTVAQNKPITVTPKKAKEITIHSEDNQVIDATTDPAIQFLNGNVKIYHAGTYMYCDNAILQGSKLRMYTNVVLLQNDTIKIFADSLRYDGDLLVAYLYGDIILENGADKKLYTTYLEYDVKNKIGYYTQNAKLVDKTSSLVSKRGRYLLNEKTAYFYENVKVTGTDFDMVSDSLAYNTSTDVTRFLAPTRINKDTSQIFSNQGWFNLATKTGDFIGNAQYLAGKTIAKSDTISYNGVLDVVTLKAKDKLSEYISEKDTAYAKEIFYDKKSETFRLTTDAYYKGKNNEVTGEKIFYNKVSEKFNVSGRSQISDPPNIIIADTLDYDKTIKYGVANGHVIWRDTAAKTAIYADHVVYKGSENYMKATNDTGRPLFTTEIEKDTLFLKADTLKSLRVIKERIIYPDKDAARKARMAKNKSKTKIDIDNTAAIDTIPITNDSISTALLSENDSLAQKIQTDTIYTGIMDTIDYFVGDNNVRMYKKDMQSVCDSLVFNKSDSLFTLFSNPFVWSDSTQIAGDTIDLLMKNSKVDRLIVRSQGTILSSPDLQFFNQIQGRFIEAFFKESKIYRMDVDGNAQIVYYITDDDKAYVGVNTTESSNMTFFLKDNKMTDIHCYKEPKSKVIPMQKADHEKLKVKGFKWNVTARPETKDNL